VQKILESPIISSPEIFVIYNNKDI
jgi:hypothetical protein